MGSWAEVDCSCRHGWRAGLQTETQPTDDPRVVQSSLFSPGHFCACSATYMPSHATVPTDHDGTSQRAPGSDIAIREHTKATSDQGARGAHEVGGAGGLGLESRIERLVRVLEGRLGAAGLTHGDVWEARLYHRADLSEGGGARGVAGALRDVLARSGFPAGRVVAMPVLAVGSGPEVLGGLHLEALAHRR